MTGILTDREAQLASADDTVRVTRTCARCEEAHTDTDRGFAALGWALLRRRLLCPACLPRKYRGTP